MRRVYVDVNPDARPRLAKGNRLRRDPDGTAMLLVPEGALVLNEPAAAALELLDGRRTVAEIAAALVARFEVSEAEARDDVCRLLERLAARCAVDLA